MRVLFVFLATAFVFSACNKEVDSMKTNSNNKGEDSIEEISFIEYILTDSTCYWKNFQNNEGHSSELIIINNYDELNNELECEEATDESEIDFSKQTLLLTRGVSTSSDAEVLDVQLDRVAEGTYALYVKVRRGKALTPGPWAVAIITQKISDDAIVTLNVEQIDN